MTNLRTATLVNFGLRAAYGVFMLATPAKVGRPWVGHLAGTTASTVPLRGIGGRELALHAAGAAAVASGAPLRPWLLASLGGDLTDIITAAISRDDLPDGGFRAVLLTGGGSAVMTAALLAASER
jgi:hypothetical protein